jgi:exo-1,4-beta-D-glucosaminidase
MRRHTLLLIAVLASLPMIVPLVALAHVLATPDPATSEPVISAQTAPLELLGGWEIQSSCESKDAGDKISQRGFFTAAWHKTTIPNTVVGTLVDDKTYPDPMVGTNFKNLPGMNYSSATFFANQDMPEGSPFKCSWWWRNEFVLPAAFAKKNIAIHFPGIHYRANVWFNGQKIADAQDIAGTYRIFEFDLTKLAKPGAQNVIALEIAAPRKEDLGITWVDWNPTPPDKDLGIWKEVSVTASGAVAIRNPFATWRLNEDFSVADIKLSADLRNDFGAVVRGTLVAEVDGKMVKQPVELAAGESKTVRFAAAQFAALRFVNPKLWWPYTIGTPYLYRANMRFETANEVSDSAEVTFGIRQVTSELTEKGHRLFKINGRRILIRGAAWAPDIFLRAKSKKLDADLRYVKDMGLNTIRLEGRIDRDELFNKADEMGILVMPGWTCCDAWELWDKWTPDIRKIAAASMADQARRLRNHASVFVWLYGSDNPPPAEIEQMYLSILKDAEWPNPSVSSASQAETTVTGKSGVKMTGPYEYVPPVYWLADTDAGGAHGYNTETSPGPAIPTLESLKRFIPKDHLWPIDDMWNFHAGGERFTTVNVFTDGLNKRYGTATSLEDYERKAQAAAYDGERAMFEAYGRNKYVSTGVIQWMLNNAWPSLIWHLYDYYLVPGGGYFGTKRAMEPVHVQYGYNDQSVAVVNETSQEHKGMKVRARVYSLEGKLLAHKEESLDVPADASVKAFDLPKADGLTTTFFVKLDLRNLRGKTVSANFYWLSAKPDTLDWAHKQDTVYTPQAEFGDLTGLNSLPQIKLQTTALVEQTAGATTGKAHVRVKNPSSSVAFQVRLRLANKKDDLDVAPVFWEDNYFSLLPGEERIISVSYDTANLQGTHPVIQVGGFNIEAGGVPPGAAAAH